MSVKDRKCVNICLSEFKRVCVCINEQSVYVNVCVFSQCKWMRKQWRQCERCTTNREPNTADAEGNVNP